MNERRDIFEEYLAITGQILQEAMASATCYGTSFIEKTLIPQALQEKKRIVWVTQLINGEDVGMADYRPV